VSFTKRTASLSYRGVPVHIAEDDGGFVWYEWDNHGWLNRHNLLKSAMSFIDTLVFGEV